MRRILSIDGGGIRGVIPAVVLAAIEDKAAKPAHELFDLVAGTSTGGIIACGLKKRLWAKMMLDLYTKRGAEIFAKRWLRWFGISGPKFSSKVLRGILEAAFGETRLSDSGGPEIIVPSFCLSPTYGSHFFKSWQARGQLLDPDEHWHDHDFSLVDVAMATSAAPTFFGAAGVQGFEIAKATNTAGVVHYMVDGGTHANNPVLAADVSAEQLWPGEPRVILSIGTGERLQPIDGKAMQEAGAVDWAVHIINVCMDGSAKDSEYWAERLPNTHVYRLQIELPEDCTPMDDASPENLARLQNLGRMLVARNAQILSTFVRGTW